MVSKLMCLVGFLLVSATMFAEIPSGAVMFFNRVECPTGWHVLDIAKGRTIVGLNESGSLGAQVGHALLDQENRSVGEHNHAINDPGHYHGIRAARGWMTRGQNIGVEYYSSAQTDAAKTGVTVKTEGAVPGTPAPYLQLLTCEKD